MEQLLDLNTFAKTLTEKGYDGYFRTEAAYPDKIKDSISRFLEDCRNGTDKPMQPSIFSLSTYIEWDDEYKPSTDCYMRVRYEDGKFEVCGMEIRRTDQYGHLLKKSELTNLTTVTVPTRKEAFALVSDPQEKKLSYKGRRFGM